MTPIAKIIRSDSTDGGILVSSTVELRDWPAEDPLYIEFDGLETPFFIRDCRPKGSRYIIHLHGVTSLQDSEELVGREILADADEEPEESFEGWQVFDLVDGREVLVGTVTAEAPIPGNFCLYVRRAADGAEGSGDEVLIPLHDDFIVEATEGRLVLDLPEGLY